MSRSPAVAEPSLGAIPHGASLGHLEHDEALLGLAIRALGLPSAQEVLNDVCRTVVALLGDGQIEVIEHDSERDLRVRVAVASWPGTVPDAADGEPAEDGDCATARTPSPRLTAAIGLEVGLLRSDPSERRLRLAMDRIETETWRCDRILRRALRLAGDPGRLVPRLLDGEPLPSDEPGADGTTSDLARTSPDPRV